jgi:hypothetical protein
MFCNALFTEDHAFHIRCVGHDREDHVGMFCDFSGRRTRGATCRSQWLQGFRAARIGPQLVPAFHQIERHGAAHDARADESNVDCHISSPVHASKKALSSADYADSHRFQHGFW